MEKAVLKQTTVQHLYSQMSGRLRPRLNEADLMRALHPTPAVCGQPQDLASALINEHEPFDRGFYAGPVGWMNGDSAEFVVAIRSALVDPVGGRQAQTGDWTHHWISAPLYLCISVSLISQFTGPPVPITARVHSTSQSISVSLYLCTTVSLYHCSCAAVSLYHWVAVSLLYNCMQRADCRRRGVDHRQLGRREPLTTVLRTLNEIRTREDMTRGSARTLHSY
eukprot:3254998-Pyramimonas_sp.AAC.1